MHEEETLIRRFKPSILQFVPIFLMPVVILVFLGLFGGSAFFFTLFWLFEIFAIILALGQLIGTTYSVTSKRIMVQRGLFGRESEEVPIDKVTNFFLRQSFFQRILGIGNIEIDTGSGAPLGMTLSGIEQPSELVDFLFSLKG